MSDQRVFRRPVVTRGYELDTTRTISIPVIMNYLEHLRWEVMQEPELGLDAALAEGHFFVVGQQDIELIRRVGMGVPLELALVMRKVGRSRVVVEHSIRRADRDVDNLVAHARVVGMWMGPSRRLARVPDSLREVGRRHEGIGRVVLDEVRTSGFPTREEAPSFIDRPEVTHQPRGIDVLKLPEFELPLEADVYRHRLTVRPSDLDLFEHVNASTYLKFFEDARTLAGLEERSPWGAAQIGGLFRRQLARAPHVRASVSYHREALLQDALEVVMWLESSADDGRNRFQFLLCRGDEQPLCRATVEID